MPIYIYECPKCKTQKEIFHTSSGTGPITWWCNRCNVEAKRIIAPTNFVLKGDGWAKDNYTKKEKDAQI